MKSNRMRGLRGEALLSGASQTITFVDVETQRPIGYKFRRYYADLQRRTVLRNERPVHLTRKQFDILHFFLQNPRQIVAREDIAPLQAKGRIGREPADDYIKMLRSKLGWDCFTTHRGIGYRFDVDVEPVFRADRQEANALHQISLLHFNEHTVSSITTSREISARAVEIDPDVTAEAHVTTAYDHINLSHAAFSVELPSELIPYARIEAETALAKEPQLASAHGVIGLISLVYDYNWQEAERSFVDALELNPNETATLLSYAHFLVCSNRTQEAINAVETASGLVPTDQLIQTSVAWIYLFAGQLEMALERAEDAREKFPRFAPGHMMLGWVQEACRDHEAAKKSYKKSLELDRTPIAIASLGHLQASMGNSRMAELSLKNLIKLYRSGRIAYVSGFCQALVLVGLKRYSSALSALERAYRERCDWLIHLRVDSRWAPLHQQKRFIELAKKVGIPTSAA
jgi:tetratricopeptide (TPR) repeat protein